jgi:hypothetical protein
MAARADEGLSSDTFYARQPGQVFKASLAQDMTVGYLQGDDVPYMTWDGRFGKRAAYVELHGDELVLRSGQRVWHRRLSQAVRVEGEAPAVLDSKGVTIFLKAEKAGRDSFICVESLPDGAGQSAPFRSVYLLADPLGKLTVYQLPELYGSCKGLMARGNGVHVVPYWQRLPDGQQKTHAVEWLRLAGRKGFSSTGVSETLTELSLDRFERDAPRPDVEH